MDIYSATDTVPLSFSRVRNNALVSGLSVSVAVKDAKTGAVLLASTTCPEVAASSGIYTYSWTHGLTSDTICLVTYSVGATIYTEQILISNSLQGGRAV